MVEITISEKKIEEAIEEDDVSAEKSPSFSPTKAAQEEEKIAAVAEVIDDDDRVSSGRVTRRMETAKLRRHR